MIQEQELPADVREALYHEISLELVHGRPASSPAAT